MALGGSDVGVFSFVFELESLLVVGFDYSLDVFEMDIAVTFFLLKVFDDIVQFDEACWVHFEALFDGSVPK